MKTVAAILLLTVAGCSSTSGTFCKIAPKLEYRQQVYDAMTEAEQRRHLSYLKTGEQLCGWRR